MQKNCKLRSSYYHAKFRFLCLYLLPPPQDKYMTWENLQSNYSTQLSRHFAEDPL